jgi:flagellar biosynthesis GTPase FlhF
VNSLRGGEGDIRPRTGLSEFGDYPLAKSLLSNGASMPAVRHLANLFKAEGGEEDDPIAHLRSIFQTSNAKLNDLSGCHVFLGNSGVGKTEMIMSLARELAATKKILVLTLYPRDEADTQRLRDNSEKSGFDAAVLRDGQQLMSAMQLVDGYDLVLIDTPALQSPVMAMAPVQQRIVQENRMHRHLVVAMDHDLRDTEAVWRQTREWNCDWMAMSRLDMLDRPGKLLDLLLNSPLSVSLRAGGLRHERAVDVVSDAWLVQKTCGAKIDESPIDTSKQAQE